MSFIYVIQSGDNTLKIGKANDVRKRARALQTAHPFQLRVLRKFEVGAADVLPLEKEIHKRLKEYRLHGEWFRVQPSIAIRVIEMCSNGLQRQQVQLVESEQALKDYPGTITRSLYCPKCFHRGTAHVAFRAPLPSFRCSKCGTKPLISGINPIGPWLRARRRAREMNKLK
jgi:hypothetical protein